MYETCSYMTYSLNANRHPTLMNDGFCRQVAILPMQRHILQGACSCRKFSGAERHADESVSFSTPVA